MCARARPCVRRDTLSLHVFCQRNRETQIKDDQIWGNRDLGKFGWKSEQVFENSRWLLHAIPCMLELKKLHRALNVVHDKRDGRFLWAISDALWYVLKALKGEFLNLFRGSTIFRLQVMKYNTKIEIWNAFEAIRCQIFKDFLMHHPSYYLVF